MRLLLLFGLSLLFRSDLAAQNGCISGSVFDTLGAPIAYVHVIGASSDRRASFDVTTDRDGNFRIDTVPAGDYEVATDDEYKTDSPNIRFATAMPAHTARAAALAGDSCGSVTLRPPVRARLRLKVTNLLTAEVVPSIDAGFRFDSHSSWNGSVNEERELAVPPLAVLEVEVGALGYERSELIKVAPVEPGEIREVTVALRPVETGCITGIVTDQQGKAVVGARVQAELSSDATDRIGREVPAVLTQADGRFKFDVVHPGRYVVFAHGKLEEYPIDQGDPEFTALTVRPSQGCAELTINLGPKAARLQIEVVDAVTQKPLKYSAWASGKHVRGGWTLNMVANPMPVPALKQFEVTVRASGYGGQNVMVAPLQPEETFELTIELEPERSAASRPAR
jgi:hypothetical protein